MNAYAIELEGVTLKRDDRVILSDVTAAIRPGEFIGVFGPNGAGKSTLLHALLGLLKPAAGRVRLFGAAPARGNRGAGYLPQRRAPIDSRRLRGWDFVASAMDGERWGIARTDRKGAAEVDRSLERVEAQALAQRPMGELSGGELQRLLLAQALLGRPSLLLLDEPMVSLDPRFQQSIVDLVKRIQHEDGTTVLLTAHELNPLLGAMDRVLYLGQRHAALGSVDEIITTEVLSRIYGGPIDVLRIDGRIVVVSGHGPVEAEAHRHDA